MIVLKANSPVINPTIKKEYKDLLMAIQALPGIEMQNCSIPTYSFKEIIRKWSSLIIFFTSTSTEEGLFFLTRATDRRYWQHGDKWRVQVECGDQIFQGKNGHTKLTYSLLRPLQELDTEEIVLDECKSLYQNMNELYHHEGFMKGFNMFGYYQVVDEVQFNREVKLGDLGV